MDWVALISWGLVAVLALAAVLVPLVSLAGQAMFVMAGFAASVVLVITGTEAFAWVAMGLAIVGLVLGGVAAAALVNDSSTMARGARPWRKETAAFLEGFELPLLVTAGLLSLWVALQ